ncbi:MAG: Asp-tRNA(Asn)/Glu-tRNA(Gln) amidotransferase subunit GatA [Patescibacteria group bacterium]|nr:Asp-tRNA(Asn)/Glu-tRNA(Gln) amidotransferase subunit GatA [Patescibacteria group bacterium]MDD5715410.1 Asp-tRNA(Asn)/Glu-tRNA(Gln) amidotransferase subunit GatA [Patescibacteria group bacterium]
MKNENLTIAAAREKLRTRELSSVELTEFYLARIKKHDPTLHAYLRVDAENALRQAREADMRIQDGTAGPLCGIPIAIKDLICQKGSVTTAGSKTLQKYVAPYDAAVITKLRDAGAIFLGKTNLDEFAMGSSTENSAFAKTANPWDVARVPGGSSGGSAAAVAADLCVGALGTDTGGSIRQPASFCGTVGLKPTYGSVSRYGLMAMTSSLDQIGPLTKTVEDAASVLNAIAGKDPHDATTADTVPVSIDSLKRGVKGMKIGVPREYFIEGMDPEIEAAVRAAIEKLKELGAAVVDVSLPLTKYALAVYQLTVTSEVSTNLARFDGIRYGYSAMNDKTASVKTLMEVYQKTRARGLGDEVKRRIILGTFALSAGYHDRYYVQAQKVRALIAKEFQGVFKEVDCLVTPTSPSIAFKLGEKFTDPLLMYLSDIYTVPANIGGICAISLPCGLSKGLPVGLQIIAKPFDEAALLRAAYAYEQATEWHTKRPPLN